MPDDKNRDILADKTEVEITISEPETVDKSHDISDDKNDAKSVVFNSEAPTEPLPVNPDDEAITRKTAIQLITEALKSFNRGLTGRKVDPAESSFKSMGNAWVATYSNNFKDRDGEIFPARAIDQYIARVDKGLVPLPELWVWHAGKSSRVGQAGVVARQGHFVLAAGTWDDTPQGQTARTSTAKHQKDTSLSHGFTYNKLAFDGVHYNDFNTFEISLLPRGVEANRYTTLEGVKAMQISDEKKKYLTEKLGEAGVTKVLADLAERDKEVEALGVEFKDFGHLDETETVSGDEADKAMAELMADVINGQGESLKASVATLKAVKAFETRMAAQDATIAALKEQLDGRPRSASNDRDTELTPENLASIVKAATQKDPITNSFFGIPVEES